MNNQWIVTINLDKAKEHTSRHFVAVRAGEAPPIGTPEAEPISSDSCEFMEFMADSLNVFGLDLCGAMSPYGIESSFIDFGISAADPHFVDMLMGSYDESIHPKWISREEWENYILKSPPRIIAIYVCLGANIGWTWEGFQLVNEGTLPSIGWCRKNCVIFNNLSSDADRIDIADITELAEDIPEYGPPILRNDSFQENCIACVRNDSEFTQKTCAISVMFSYIAKYAAFAKSDN